MRESRSLNSKKVVDEEMKKDDSIRPMEIPMNPETDMTHKEKIPDSSGTTPDCRNMKDSDEIEDIQNTPSI